MWDVLNKILYEFRSSSLLYIHPFCTSPFNKIYFPSFFPPPERLAALALGAGYEILSNGYVQRETVNLKEDVHVPRIFLQAKLQKPTRTLR